MADSSDFLLLRRVTRRREHRLPSRLRRLVRRIRRDDLRAHFVAHVLGEVEARARRVAAGRELNHPGDPFRYFVPIVPEREILRQLAENDSFCAELHASIRGALAQAHREKADPSQVVEVHASRDDAHAPPTDGLWVPESNVGLGTASFLEAGPDGWWLWAAGLACPDARMVEGRRFEVLHYNAGPGAFARALWATTTALKTVDVKEIDSVFDSTSLAPVAPGRNGPVLDEHYDMFVWSAPAPSLGGASNHRNRYPSNLDGPGGDLGRLGPRRWRRGVEAILGRLVPAVLRPGGLAVVRLPLGIRRGDRGHRGYDARPDLLDGLAENIGELQVIRTIETGENAPVKQPYVGTSRCLWRTMVLRRAAKGARS